MINFSGGIIYLEREISEEEKIDISFDIAKFFLENKVNVKFDGNLNKWDKAELHRCLSDKYKENNIIEYVLTDNPLIDEVRLLFSPEFYTLKIQGRTCKTNTNLSDVISKLKSVFEKIFKLSEIKKIIFIIVDEWDGNNKEYNIKLNDFENVINKLFKDDVESDGEIIFTIT